MSFRNNHVSIGRGTLYSFAVAVFALWPSSWTFSAVWIAGGSGAYNTAGNWAPANVPDTAGETAQFSAAGTIDVDFPAGNNLTVGDVIVQSSDVSFVSPGVVTYNAADVFAISGSELTLSETVPAGRVDLNADLLSISGDSTITIDDGSQSTVDRVDVGDASASTAGNLHVLNGSLLHVPGAVGLVVGRQSSFSTTSSMVVDGAGTMVLADGGVLEVGLNGPGTLDVTGGATVLADRATVLLGVGAFGSRLTVDGGSTFTTRDPGSGDVGNTDVGASTFTPATVEIRGGSLFEPGQFRVRGGSDVTIEDPGTRTTVNLPIGIFDNSTILVQNGATLDLLGGGGSGFVDRGSLIVTGAGTTVNANDTISVGGDSASDPVSIQVLAGAVVQPSSGGFGLELSLATVSDRFAELIVDGTGSTLSAPEASLQMASGSNSVASLTVSGGGLVEYRRLDVGSSGTATGTINLDGGTLNSTETSTLGGATSGTGIVNVLPSGLYNAGDDIILNSGGTINLFGGELRLPTIANLIDNGGTVNWNNGTVHVLGDIPWSLAKATQLGVGSGVGFGQTLQVDGTLSLQAPLTLDGGTVSVETVSNGSLLQLQSGTFELLVGNLTIGNGGPLGETLDLPSALVVKAPTINITGTVTGNGTLEGNVTNSGGEIRVGHGDHLRLTGGTFTNSGRVEAIGTAGDPAEIEFDGAVVNSTTTGEIFARNALLRFDSGLTNDGDFSMSFGTTDVFGDVNNLAAGKIIVSGNSNTTFYDEVVNNGELRTRDGSAAVFFGDVTGAGNYTGTGIVLYEGLFSPGNSPALVSIEADASLGPGSTLEIELGGTLAGDEYDQLAIGGTATLDGTLLVGLVDGFMPTVGDEFEILNYGTLNGAFDAVQFAGALDGTLAYGASSLLLTITAVPEPDSIALILLLLAMGYARCVRGKLGETQ